MKKRLLDVRLENITMNHLWSRFPLRSCMQATEIIIVSHCFVYAVADAAIHCDAPTIGRPQSVASCRNRQSHPNKLPRRPSYPRVQSSSIEGGRGDRFFFLFLACQGGMGSSHGLLASVVRQLMTHLSRRSALPTPN